MRLRGFRADAEALRDILAGGPIGEEPQHFALAMRDRAVAGGVVRAGRTMLFLALTAGYFRAVWTRRTSPASRGLI